MKVKSQFYDDASGSTGLLTWANGNGGLTMKNKPIPKNPKSPRQDHIRRALALANTSWTAMTKDARDSWERWGKTLVKYDRLKNKLVINGWSAFSGAFVLNALSSFEDTKLLLGAPTIGNYSSAVAIACVSTPTHFILKNTSNVSLSVMTFYGPTTKPTINVNKGGYQYHETVTMAGGSHIDLSLAMEKDSNTFFRFVTVEDTGRHSLHHDVTVYTPK